ncbi:MAG: amidohydrolase family protein [Cyclobacteriaceae bacterium]
MIKSTYLFLVLAVILCSCDSGEKDGEVNPEVTLFEVNKAEIPKGDKFIALVGATLIDGNGGEPLKNSCVLIRNNKIEWVGEAGDSDILEGADVIDVKGLTLLPGLIDAHYHNEDSYDLATLYLKNGVTSVRDPGEWIESYDSIRSSGKFIPRLFLAGPHFDTYPPAYPADSYLIKDASEARLAVVKFVGEGASVIKVYYGLSIAMIREICNVAHRYGVPVTAHLEITNARDAIDAGLDGIEHITSFGTCLLPLREAEKYKQHVMADNDARKRGRYEVWNSLNFENNPTADSLIQFLSDKKTFVSATLAVFERRADKSDSIEVKGFANMLKFVGAANRGGVRFVVGSHTYVPYAEFGFAFFRELELLKEAGLSNMEVIEAATMENARFFRIGERLGSIEKDKIADLILVEGDPLKDIRAMRNVKKVMLNGRWIEK